MSSGYYSTTTPASVATAAGGGDGGSSGSYSATGDTAAAHATATQIKTEANRLYGLGMYGAAAEKYTEAILFAPRWSVLFSNRALCYKQKKSWQLCLTDCERALELDASNHKAHFMLGEALTHVGRVSEGVSVLDAAKRQADAANLGKDFLRSIQITLERARRSLAEEQEAVDISEDAALLTFLESTVSAQLDVLVATQTSQLEALNSPPQAVEDAAQAIRDAHNYRLKQLRQVFNERQDRRMKRREVPDYYQCSVSMCLMRDPVVTPAGHSYDRTSIIDCLKVKQQDPITREALTPADLRPNLALRQAIEAYCVENPFAYEDSE